jgi:hypothetical protein
LLTTISPIGFMRMFPDRQAASVTSESGARRQLGGFDLSLARELAWACQ